jgi:hypothetical protein
VRARLGTSLDWFDRRARSLGSMSRMSEKRTALVERLREIFERRDRANMQPTIDEFRAVLAEHPDDPDVLYEVGGAYDTDGQEGSDCGRILRARPGRRLEWRNHATLPASVRQHAAQPR